VRLAQVLSLFVTLSYAAVTQVTEPLAVRTYLGLVSAAVPRLDLSDWNVQFPGDAGVALAGFMPADGFQSLPLRVDALELASRLGELNIMTESVSAIQVSMTAVVDKNVAWLNAASYGIISCSNVFPGQREDTAREGLASGDELPDVLYGLKVAGGRIPVIALPDFPFVSDARLRVMLKDRTERHFLDFPSSSPA
jgi:hypothetical protein